MAKTRLMDLVLVLSVPSQLRLFHFESPASKLPCMAQPKYYTFVLPSGCQTDLDAQKKT